MVTVPFPPVCSPPTIEQGCSSVVGGSEENMAMSKGAEAGTTAGGRSEANSRALDGWGGGGLGLAARPPEATAELSGTPSLPPVGADPGTRHSFCEHSSTLPLGALHCLQTSDLVQPRVDPRAESSPTIMPRADLLEKAAALDLNIAIEGRAHQTLR